MSQLAELNDTWRNDEALESLVAEEAEAIIDALAMAVYADFEYNEYEAEELAELVSSMPWAWAQELDERSYSVTALELAAEVQTEDALTTYCNKVAEQLPEEVYPTVYRMMVDITTSDGEVNEDERLVLAAFAYALALSDDEADAIYNAGLEAARI